MLQSNNSIILHAIKFSWQKIFRWRERILKSENQIVSKSVLTGKYRLKDQRIVTEIEDEKTKRLELTPELIR